MVEKTTEKKERKEEDEKEVKVSPVKPGDSRLRGRRHLLDTCE